MPEPKLARTGTFTKESFYECKMPWAEDCGVQCGDGGIVFGPTGSYRTSFFEAFPNDPDTFIRGEGATIEEAEAKAWAKLQKILACPGPNGHEYEAREYKNGAGYCKHCGSWFPDCIPAFHECCRCGEKTWWHEDIKGEWWCKTCRPNMPDDRKTDLDRRLEEMSRETDEFFGNLSEDTHA